MRNKRASFHSNFSNSAVAQVAVAASPEYRLAWAMPNKASCGALTLASTAKANDFLASVNFLDDMYKRPNCKCATSKLVSKPMAVLYPASARA